MVFEAGDVLVLQVADDSPLVKAPPPEFYKQLAESFAKTKSLFSKDALPKKQIDDCDEENGISQEAAWKDLQVVSLDKDASSSVVSGGREFLAAMEVAPKSQLAKGTAGDSGLDKIPGVFLVSIDRPTIKGQSERKKNLAKAKISQGDDVLEGQCDGASLETLDPLYTAVAPEARLEVGDVLWFAGSASAVGDLRKIPGLVSYESDEVNKVNEKLHNRRLVEAVIGRRGPLVGMTVKEIKFRTKYGAAVIAVHRDGKRIHDHPGKIKLQAGDVLLLEAGTSFMQKSSENNRAFALIAEVEDSAPPRLYLLIPALVLTVTMLAVYTAEVASLLVCALIGSALFVYLGILSEQEARDAVNWDIYIAIASAFGIGNALVNSGVASVIAEFLVNVGENIGLGGKFDAHFLVLNEWADNSLLDSQMLA